MIHINQYSTRVRVDGVFVDQIRNITFCINSPVTSGADVYMSKNALEDVVDALERAASCTGCGSQSDAWLLLAKEIETLLKGK